MDDEIMSGQVRTVRPERGFFFVRGVDGVEYFAHKSSLQNRVRIGQLQEGDTCTFLPTASPKGPRAESVVVPRLADANDPLAEIGL